MCCGDEAKDSPRHLPEENAFRVDGHDGGVKTEEHHEETRVEEHHEEIVDGDHHDGGVKVVTSSGEHHEGKRVEEHKKKKPGLLAKIFGGKKDKGGKHKGEKKEVVV